MRQTSCNNHNNKVGFDKDIGRPRLTIQRMRAWRRGCVCVIRSAIPYTIIIFVCSQLTGWFLTVTGCECSDVAERATEGCAEIFARHTSV